MKPLALKYCFIIAITTSLLSYTYQNCSEVNNRTEVANSQSTTITPDLDQLLKENEANNPIAIIKHDHYCYKNIMTD